MKDASNKKYFEYLLQRSKLGSLYRKYWLYPKISRILQGRVLDVGCGIGDFLAFRKNTAGIDINPYNIRHCERMGLEAYLIESERYPFTNLAFDGAIMDNVLEHLTDPLPTLFEIRRILKPKGTLVVGVPGKRGYDSDTDHKCFYDQAKLSKTVENCGFETGKFLHMPVRSRWLDKNARQYCLYGIFEKT